jgi:hypothetical protein
VPFLLTYPQKDPTNQTIKEVILTLTGALTSIIGFYFGGRASETKSSEAQSGKPNPAQPIPVQPVPIQPVPVQPLPVQPILAKPIPGQYKVKTDFVYKKADGDEQFYAGNIVNLSSVPANILADWVKNKWIEPYSGPTA